MRALERALERGRMTEEVSGLIPQGGLHQELEDRLIHRFRRKPPNQTARRLRRLT